MVGYTIQGIAPPFPLFVIGFGINGFGIALQNAHANGFVAALGHTSHNLNDKAHSSSPQVESSSSTCTPASVASKPALPTKSTEAGVSGTKMSFLHAAYGLGAFFSPFVATQFAALPGQKRWANHYFVSLGISFAHVIFLILVFRGQDQDCESKRSHNSTMQS